MEATQELNDSLSFLDAIVEKLDAYEPFMINDCQELQEMTKKERFNFYEKLKKCRLSSSIVHFKYSPYGGLTTYHFVWKIPSNNANRDDSMYAKVTAQIYAEIPTYHTRLMKKEFHGHFSSLCKASPAVYRAMCCFLTVNPINSTVLDLREENARPTKYEPFWDGLSKILEQVFPDMVMLHIFQL